MNRTVSALTVAITITAASTALAAPIWVETFDTDVGRFSNTISPGDQRFVWRSFAQDIGGIFVNDAANDRRYADLDQSFNVHDNILGFSVVMRAEASTPADDVGSAVGFWNSNNDFSQNRLNINMGIGDSTLPADDQILIEGHYADGSPITPSAPVAIRFLTDYFIDVLVDGPNHTITMTVHEGRDATAPLVGQTSTILDPTKPLTVDSLGMGGRAGLDQILFATVDNFAFTIPEPATAAFLLLGAACFLRKPRRTR